MIQGRSQCSVEDIRVMQLTVFRVCFHLEVETRFATSSKMLNLQARMIWQIVTVKCYSSKSLVIRRLPKRQSVRDWIVGCSVN